MVYSLLIRNEHLSGNNHLALGLNKIYEVIIVNYNTKHYEVYISSLISEICHKS